MQEEGAAGMNGKLIAGQYRFPPDMEPEQAITVYALAPYERGVRHEVDSFIGVVSKPGANPLRFEAASMEEVAGQIGKILNTDAQTILGQLSALPQDHNASTVTPSD